MSNRHLYPLLLPTHLLTYSSSRNFIFTLLLSSPRNWACSDEYSHSYTFPSSTSRSSTQLPPFIFFLLLQHIHFHSTSCTKHQYQPPFSQSKHLHSCSICSYVFFNLPVLRRARKQTPPLHFDVSDPEFRISCCTTTFIKASSSLIIKLGLSRTTSKVFTPFLPTAIIMANFQLQRLFLQAH